MRLALLGPVELADDDGMRVTVGSKRQLLAIFGLYREQIVTTETITDLIWGEEPPADPNGTVQTNVSRLRRLLSDPLSITTGPDGYLFTCPETSLDVAEFETLVNRVRQAETEGIPELARRGLSLWRTHRLLGDLDHPDIEAERQRLTEMRLDMTETLADSLRQIGRHAESIELLESHIRDHPYRERPVAILMRALHAHGRQADALAAFTRLRDTLREELGVIRPWPYRNWSWRSSNRASRSQSSHRWRRSWLWSRESGSAPPRTEHVWLMPSLAQGRLWSRRPTG